LIHLVIKSYKRMMSCPSNTNIQERPYQRRLRLIIRHHMSRLKHPHKRHIPRSRTMPTCTPHRARLRPLALALNPLDPPLPLGLLRKLVLELGIKHLHPSLVTHIVAHHIRIASIDEEAHTRVDEVGQESSGVARSITSSDKRLVHLHVARGELEGRRDAKLSLDAGVVQPILDPGHLAVAQITIFLPIALLACVVRVAAGLWERTLVSKRNGMEVRRVLTNDGTHELTVTVQQRRHTRKPIVIIITRLHQPLARRHLRPETLVLRTLGVIHRIRTFA